MAKRALRLLLSLSILAAITFAAHALSINSTTAGFAYLLVVLILATAWGFFEAAVASIAATLALNYYFLPPVGTFTIADPHNWVALFSFLTTSLIASRLSTEAKRRALEAIERQQDVERLYTFSRAILLIGSNDPFAAQLTRKLQEIFELSAAVLYDRRTGEFHRAGPADVEGLEDRLRDAALHGASFSDTQSHRSITAIRLGAEPIASLAVQGARMPDSVLQGIANLVAIGLERARAQEFAHQVEASRQSEQLRRTLIDAMAHEFKTPLTSIRAATTSLLDNPDQPAENRRELIKIADEEAERLSNLIDGTVELAQLDTAHIRIQPEMAKLNDIVREVVGSMQREIDRPAGGDFGRRAVSCQRDGPPPDPACLKAASGQCLEVFLSAHSARDPGHRRGRGCFRGNQQSGSGDPVRGTRPDFRPVLPEPGRRAPDTGFRPRPDHIAEHCAGPQWRFDCHQPPRRNHLPPDIAGTTQGGRA